MSGSRQLAAIMFTDIVGYTAIMQANEREGRIQAKHYRQVLNKQVAGLGGKVIQNFGDGSLSVFPSAVDAVKCAMALQTELKKTPPVPLRIGIHLGDIVEDEGELYGDGINVASRIESMGMAGAVLVSQSVQDQIKNHQAFQLTSLGSFEFKNVEEPIEVFALSNQGFTIPDPKSLRGKFRETKPAKSTLQYILIAAALLIAGWWVWQQVQQEEIGTKKSTLYSIAVLPLKLVNEDSTNQFLVKGINEELVRSLGKVKELSVINPVSTMQFAASAAPVSDALSRLAETTYFLTGSAESRNNQLSLDLALLDRNEQEIWTSQYQQDLAMLPQLTGQIAVDITKAIKISLDPAQTARITMIPPVDPEIFELWVKGMTHLFKFTPEDFAKAMSFLTQAKDKNPADSRAWSFLAEGLVYMGHSPSPPPGVWKEAKAAAIRAIQLDSLNPEAWGSLAHTKTYFEWDYDGAVYCYDKANALNPNMAMNHYHYSWYLYLFDSLDKAIEEHKIARDLDPLNPFHSAWLGSLYVHSGDLDSALMEVERSLRLIEDFPVANMVKGQIYQQKQDYDSAEYFFERSGALKIINLGHLYFRSGQIEKGTELIKQMQSEPLNSYNALVLASLYGRADSLDKFFEFANYEPPHAWFPWLRKNVDNSKLINDPRFKQLMVKMNLPMPNEKPPS